MSGRGEGVVMTSSKFQNVQIRLKIGTETNFSMYITYITY